MFYRKHETNETRLQHELLDETESNHRSHALSLLSNFSFSEEERSLHALMVSKAGLTTAKEVGLALQWLSKLEDSVNLTKNKDVSHFYHVYGMRVARKNANLGWKVIYYYVLSKHFSNTKWIDILALSMMTIFKINSKHKIPSVFKWFFYKFKG